MTARDVKSRLTNALPGVLLGLTFVFFMIRARHGIKFLPFVDESEHLLGGKMLNAGAVLYRDFITQHGPVTFMLTQAYGALLGWKHPNSARWISALLALGATACVGTSASLTSRASRSWASALFIGLFTSIWLVQAIYLVNYHTIGGFALAASLALFILPLWLGAPVNTARAASAGVCLALLPATAYSFAPATVVLGISTLWAAWRSRQTRLAWAFVAGFVAAVLAVLLWLLRVGDLIGYFAFHFAENQFVFSKFNGLSWRYFAASQYPSWAPDARVHALGLLCWALSCVLMLALDLRGARPARGMAGPILLGAAGMIALCARGGTGFQDGSFLLGSMAALAVAAGTAMARFLPAPRALGLTSATLGVALCIAAAELSNRGALYTPFGMTRAEAVSLPYGFYNLGTAGNPLSLRIRALTRPDETILAVPYAPYVYLEANRPPMRRYFYYLPWDAAYAKTPYFGQTHDLCEDLPKAPPVVIYYDKWVVWNRWEMATYMPCFITYLKANYTQQPDLPNLYVRNDRQPHEPPPNR